MADERAKMRAAAQEQQRRAGARAAAPATTGTATSRAGTVRSAVRKPTKARLALAGPSGSGKTWTALTIARTLSPSGRVIMIDTEPSDDLNSAAELYADVFDFEVIDWRNPPFDPRDLELTITELGARGDVDVVILDSASPFWRGQGGTLDLADGRFGGWKEATPAQDRMIHAMLVCPMHVIFCTRVKQQYEVSGQGRDDMRVEKLGLAPIQRDDVEYEFQVVATIDGAHRIDIGKTRCQPLAGLSFPANDQGRFAEIYRDWIMKGEDVARVDDVQLILAAFNRIADEDERATAKRAFGREVGIPKDLQVADLGPAWLWLSTRLDVDPHPYQPSAAADGVCASCGLGRKARWHVGDELPPVRAAKAADADEANADGATGASDATGGESGPPSSDGGEAATGDEASSSPDSEGETGQSDTATTTAEPGAEPEPEQVSDPGTTAEPDTGHCAACGAPIFLTPDDAWEHADRDDDGIHEGPIVPAGEGIDVDELYAATHLAASSGDEPSSADEAEAAMVATITAEVEAMTAAAVQAASKHAGISLNGTPRTLKARYLAWRLEQASSGQ